MNGRYRGDPLSDLIAELPADDLERLGNSLFSSRVDCRKDRDTKGWLCSSKGQCMSRKRLNRSRAAWCDRTMLQSQHIGLCVNERQFHRELLKLEIKPRDWPKFGHGYATTHFFENHKLGRLAIVCIDPLKGKTTEQLYALLVHEAVHVWQSERDFMDEKTPGHETEAYAIQNIAQGLMQALRQLR